MNDFYNHEHYPDPTPYEALKELINEQSGRRCMPLVFICSPFSGNTEKNTDAARRYCRFAVDSGFIPIAPHLIYPQFLDDTKADERQLGMFFGKVLMTKCKEVWVFGPYMGGDDRDYMSRNNNLRCFEHIPVRVSPGMQEEIAYARKKHIKIRYFTGDYKEVER